VNDLISLVILVSVAVSFHITGAGVEFVSLCRFFSFAGGVKRLVDVRFEVNLEGSGIGPK
jgi:hypothetical protein